MKGNKLVKCEIQRILTKFYFGRFILILYDLKYNRKPCPPLNPQITEALLRFWRCRYVLVISTHIIFTMENDYTSKVLNTKIFYRYRCTLPTFSYYSIFLPFYDAFDTH